MTSSLEDAIAEMASEFDLGVGKTVVDLGAGRGERARLLAATGARVIAMEPSPAMRAELAHAVATVEIVDGTAGGLPLPEWTADLVVVADAAEWLGNGAAAAEIHRVLRPGGGLAVLAVPAERGGPSPWPPSVGELFGPADEGENVYWCRKG